MTLTTAGMNNVYNNMELSNLTDDEKDIFHKIETHNGIINEADKILWFLPKSQEEIDIVMKLFGVTEKIEKVTPNQWFGITLFRPPQPVPENYRPIIFVCLDKDGAREKSKKELDKFYESLAGVFEHIIKKSSARRQ